MTIGEATILFVEMPMIITLILVFIYTEWKDKK